MYHIFDFVRRKEGALHRAVVFKVVSGAARGPDDGSDCALEVSDRDRSLEDADPVVVPGVFSFGADTVCGGRWGGEDGAEVFTGVVLCRGEAGAVRDDV